MKKSFVKFVALALVLIMVLGAVPVSAASKTIENAGSLLNDMFGWLFMPIPQGSAFPEQEFLPPEVDGVTVTVRAPEGALPAGTDIEVAPVDMAAVQNAVDASSEVSGTVLAAVDITFRYRGEEIQPTAPVTVTMTSAALEGQDNLTVVHIDDQRASHAESVFAEFEEDTATFDADKFSVYAVIDESGSNSDLITVEFYAKKNGQWEKINAQAIRRSMIESMVAAEKDPVFDPGVPSITEGQSFEGWADTSAHAVSDDYTGLSVAEINDYVVENKDNTNITTITYYAMVFNVRYVVYHDQAGAVLMTQSYHIHEGQNTENVKIQFPYTPFKGEQNFAGWIEAEYVDVAGDYPLYKDTLNTAYVSDGDVYKDGTTYAIDDTLQLYPFLNTGHWLVFDNYIDYDSDPTSASYTSPVFYADGEDTVAPAIPTRTGYEFKGWFRDKDFNERFIFGSPINEETTVYAKWEAKHTTYQVVFWQQNPTDAVDAADSAKTYSFYKVEQRGATTGSSVSLNLADSGTAADNRLGGNSATSIGEMGFYFSYNAVNSDTTSAVVKGDGSTVLNVYYDRKIITYNFYGDLTSYSYSSSTYNSNYPYYGVDSNNNLFRVYYRSNNNRWYDASGTRYTGTVYHLTFDTETLSNNSADVQFGSIQGLYGSTMDYFDWTSASTTISGNEWPYSGRYLMWHDATTGRYLNKAFQYTTGEATTSTTIDYYLNEYEVSSTTRPYTCLGQDVTGNYTITLDDESMKSTETLYLAGDEYYGYVLDRYNRTTNNYNSATVWDGKTVTCSYDQIGSGGHAYFYFARNKWDFVYESNSSQVKTENVYWEAELDDYASYVPTNGPEGYYFDGWYADPAFDTPFDFTQEMPNHSVMIYAKWTMMRFRVVLDPTGGEQGVNPSDITFPGNQATTFRVDYGELVQASSINNAQREGYILLGWFTDPGFTHPFNFGTPITDAIADMSYATASDADRQGSDPWNLENGQPKQYTDVGLDNVRGKVTIYAQWRQNPDGIIGINVRYLADDKNGNAGKFASNDSNTWDDPNIYADKAMAFGQAASTPVDAQGNPKTDLQFLYWEILDKNGNVVGKAYPGQLWEIDVDNAVIETLTAQAVYYTYGDKKPDEESRNGSSTRSGAGTREVTTLATTVFSDNFDEGTAFTTSTSSSGTMSTEYWTAYNPGNGNNWSNYSNSSYAHSGSRSALYEYNSSYAANCYLISKPFKISSNAASVAVSLYERVASSSYAEQFEVFFIVTDGITTNGAAINATHYNVISSASYTNTTYAEKTGSPNDLSALKGKNVRLVIHCTSSANKYALFIDDVTVTQTKTGETVTYELVNDIEAGKDYVIVVEDTHAVTNSVYANNRYINATSVVNNGDDTITFFADEESSLLYRVGGSSSGWTFYNQAAGKYLGLNAEDSHWLSMIDSPWEWLYTGTDLDNQCTDSDNQNSSGNAFRYLSYSVTYDDFTTSTGTGQNVKFYRAINTGYTVTFVDGYTNEVIDIQTVAEGDSAIAPEAPDHTDQQMIFTGWNTPFDNVTSDITVTANYVNQSSLSYTVTFRYMDSNGDWVSTSQTVRHGNAATPPDAASVAPAGYTFNSWDKKFNNITSNLTINAVYKQTATKKYTITLRALYGRANTTAKTHVYWYGNNDATGEGPGVVQKNEELQINQAMDIPTPESFDEGIHDFSNIVGGSKADPSGLVWEDHVFLGWARLDNETGSESEAKAHPELGVDDIYLAWDPTGNKGNGDFIIMKAPTAVDDPQATVGKHVTKVAADESHPYHDMYAVWGTVYYIYHSADNSVERQVFIPVKDADSGKVTMTIDLANQTKSRYLYGGYYSRYEGASTEAIKTSAATLFPDTPDIKWTQVSSDKYTLDLNGWEDDTKDGANTYKPYESDSFTWNVANAYGMTLPSKDDTNTDPNASENGLAVTPVAGRTYYLKEVADTNYLESYLYYTFHGYFEGEDIVGTGEIGSLFAISAIDDLNYWESGFIVVDTKRQASVVPTVTVHANNTSFTQTISPEEFGAVGSNNFLTFLTLYNELNTDSNNPNLIQDPSQSFKIGRYWITPDHLYVSGVKITSYASANNAKNIAPTNYKGNSVISDSPAALIAAVAAAGNQ